MDLKGPDVVERAVGPIILYEGSAGPNSGKISNLHWPLLSFLGCDVKAKGFLRPSHLQNNLRVQQCLKEK